jgi:hypothetical protein
MDAFTPLMFHTVQDTLLLLIASLLCLQWGSVSVHISSFCHHCATAYCAQLLHLLGLTALPTYFAVPNRLLY